MYSNTGQGLYMASKSLERNFYALSAKINSQHGALLFLLLVINYATAKSSGVRMNCRRKREARAQTL